MKKIKEFLFPFLAGYFSVISATIVMVSILVLGGLLFTWNFEFSEKVLCNVLTFTSFKLINGFGVVIGVIVCMRAIMD